MAEEEKIPITVRLPQSLLARIDELVGDSDLPPNTSALELLLIIAVETPEVQLAAMNFTAWKARHTTQSVQKPPVPGEEKQRRNRKKT